MCAVIGALIWNASPSAIAGANAVIAHIFERSRERGRDGWGFHVHEDPAQSTGLNYERRKIERNAPFEDNNFFDSFKPMNSAVMIGNMRAEPTTEYVAEKKEYDQQPYRCGKWTIVHNGTIANDKALRTNKLHTAIDSAAIAELLANEDHLYTATERPQYFAERIAQLKGSYAILAVHEDHPDLIFTACNYRPLWFAAATNGVFFASSRNYFPEFLVPQMLDPYSVWMFTPDNNRVRLDEISLPPAADRRALVVCSGGMDSVVAAAAAQARGYNVSLAHFRYGSRAQTPEFRAVTAIAQRMGVHCKIFEMPIYNKEDSPLLREDSTIAGGEAGAEFAHEWVPARNLVMLSVAAAYAEANGFETLVLGNNLEEAGAYPDNEPEFIARFNDMLPFAIGDGKKLEVVMPVGNMMKHEIVRFGHDLGAPLDLTWSCYRAGAVHCGRCGPCFMRRTAFEINGYDEVISYAE